MNFNFSFSSSPSSSLPPFSSSSSSYDFSSTSSMEDLSCSMDSCSTQDFSSSLTSSTSSSFPTNLTSAASAAVAAAVASIVNQSPSFSSSIPLRSEPKPLDVSHIRALSQCQTLSLVKMACWFTKPSRGIEIPKSLQFQFQLLHFIQSNVSKVLSTKKLLLYFFALNDDRDEGYHVAFKDGFSSDFLQMYINTPIFSSINSNKNDKLVLYECYAIQGTANRTYQECFKKKFSTFFSNPLQCMAMKRGGFQHVFVSEDFMKTATAFLPLPPTVTHNLSNNDVFLVPHSNEYDELSSKLPDIFPTLPLCVHSFKPFLLVSDLMIQKYNGSPFKILTAILSVEQTLGFLLSPFDFSIPFHPLAETCQLCEGNSQGKLTFLLFAITSEEINQQSININKTKLNDFNYIHSIPFFLVPFLHSHDVHLC